MIATQNVVDPRRLGQQNSGFSDEDISDIICILVPYSESARQELKRIANENSHHMVTRNDTDRLDLDYAAEDNADNFGLVQQDVGEHHVALRFSAQVKSPLQGFTFGRNPTRCDICLLNDPHRRLSNIHFRIYFNEHAVLMLEDQSTNGTIVDDNLLKSKANPGMTTKRTLVSGSKIKILMHQGTSDIVFLVRVPLREGRHYAAYQRNLDAYMRKQARQVTDANETIVPGPGGHVRALVSRDVGTANRTVRSIYSKYQSRNLQKPHGQWHVSRIMLPRLARSPVWIDCQNPGMDPINTTEFAKLGKVRLPLCTK